MKRLLSAIVPGRHLSFVFSWNALPLQAKPSLSDYCCDAERAAFELTWSLIARAWGQSIVRRESRQFSAGLDPTWQSLQSVAFLEAGNS